MIEIDGSQGEGGGQVLRSALSLAIATQQPFRIASIRAKRSKPGLMRQHLTSVNAAAAICGGEVVGADIGSTALTFRPGRVRAGDYAFAIGTAGSCTLVLQTVLFPLLAAEGASTVSVKGGTHNKAAPPVDFLQRSFLPLLSRMGAQVDMTLIRHGFYPKGGGEIRAAIVPARLGRLELHERGERVRAFAEAYVAALPVDIARRELDVVGKALNWGADQLLLRGLPQEQGPGNALTVTVAFAHVTEVFSGFGEHGVSAESVAAGAVREARDYLAAGAPVGEHLADQLLLPLVLGEGGSFTATTASRHLRTNAQIVERFTGRRVDIEQTTEGYRVEVR
jgi:RNA 3'-terminal phosphate cyclase (ATP)